MDSYDQAAQLRLELDEVRAQVDAAALILHPQCWHANPLRAPTAGSAPRPGSGIHEHQAV
ncbi:MULTISPECIES: hypothetical protein [Protofrankia]|uniref:hypothetical protein n=1 Tax=Protofrankia TaxID=2994361 RepID=UPI0002EF99EF|nr:MULTISPECIES: hypothetical protein [Protofrankia]